MKAYGETLVNWIDEDATNIWCSRWKEVIQLQRKLYSHPGGSIGRKFVSMLTDELSHLPVGNYTFDHLLFSVLQCYKGTRWLGRSLIKGGILSENGNVEEGGV